MNIKNIFILVGMVLIINSCNNNSVIILETGSLPSVIFEVEYVNHAWGYVHYGYYIAKDGGVHSYDIAKSGESWSDTSQGYYTERELVAKFNHLDTLRMMVARDTILWSNELARLAQYGTYSDTIQQGADMGGLSFILYLYRQDIKKYRQIVLLLNGDRTFRNESQSAIQLVAWMNRVIKRY